jgi:predicted esterase
MKTLAKNIATILLISALALLGEWQPHEIPEGVFCDPDSDCILLPETPLAVPVPALIYLSCTGGKPWDIDSVREIHNELGWAIATCGKSRNRRATDINEDDILHLHAKLERTGKVDKNRIYLFGFSGQGAQAIGTVLRHPNLFAGAVIDCAHTGGVTFFCEEASANQAFYIITKTEDWNREYSEKLHKLFVNFDIRDTLIIEKGEHAIGPAEDILRACRWFEKISTRD